MVCGRCGRAFDETKQDYCGYCRTVHTKKGEPIRDLKGILRYITDKFGAETLLSPRRADALIADFFPKESQARRLCYVALYDGCAKKLYAVREKPFEVRCAAAAGCIKSLRDEIGIKGRIAADAVEAVGCAVGCEISFKKSEILPASETESKKNITDAAEQYSLGRHFDRIHEYEKALYWFESAALQDHGEAEYYMGSYRLEGRGGIQDINQAREWFVRGAENGVAQAEYMMGYFYAEGIACELDEDKAFRCFISAAKKGCADAANIIALCYENGVHAEKDPELAKKWRNYSKDDKAFELPPETEVPEPLADDGEELYQSARRCLAEKDAEGAAMFYKRAAEVGHARAQCSYGKCLYTGNGVAKDPAEAFRWFKKASDQNLNIAQYNLGVMYLKGVYVPKDLEQAKTYFTQAAENGHEDAEKILKKLQ
ncbi:MAG: sel1 repeat family protein [Oscillospiraceae bacterium]|nr:sel1 repeat family protein [Oscillospiraceae bacterium]